MRYDKESGEVRFSASDLVKFANCGHLTALERGLALGLPGYERPERSEESAVIARRGDMHETEQVERLRGECEAAGEELVEVADDRGISNEVRRDQTLAAMHEGARFICQGVLMDDQWLGVIDLLRRVDDIPAPGLGTSWSYEVVDMKLARTAKPAHVLQLCLYSDLLCAQQGVMPRRAALLLGTGKEHPVVLADTLQWYGVQRQRFEQELARLDAGGEPAYPEPVPHCGVCEWAPRCKARLQADDHLSLVAGMRGSQRHKLESAEVTTVAQLAELPSDTAIPRMATDTLDKLRDQASLQVRGRAQADPIMHLLPRQADRGLDALPAADPGDVFFDFEGDPFIAAAGLGAAAGKGGLEYLWGLVTVDTDAPEFIAKWAHDSPAERAAFEWFIDWVTARLATYPGLHVYHYAPYEVTALKRLASRYASRENDLDDLLRGGVFVDLYRIVTHAMRTSQPSYSIKDIEAFYRKGREGDVKTAASSIVAYEAWLEDGDEARLTAIADYNRDDCISTWELRNWLLDQLSKHPEPAPPADEQPDEPDEDAEAEEPWWQEYVDAQERLLEGIDLLTSGAGQDEQARWVLAQLLFYFWRERKTYWWSYFDWRASNPDDLIDDDECIGDINAVPIGEPVPVKSSLLYTLSFPPQHTKLRAGSQVSGLHDDFSLENPDAKAKSFTIEEIDSDAGRLVLRRGNRRTAEPLPRSLCPPPPPPTGRQEGRLLQLAQIIIAGDDATAAAGGIARAILRRDTPRIAGIGEGDELMPRGRDVDVDALTELVAGLEESYLPIQGPPGTGKTWSSAQAIVRLMERGLTVGVSAYTHAAIKNLLAEVEYVTIPPAVPVDSPSSTFS